MAAAAAARSSFFMNPQQFKHRIPYQTDPIFAVNLPKRRRSHPCTSNDKTRPLQLKDGAIKGPRRLRVGNQRSLPGNDNDFWISGLDDPLLADVLTKERKYCSSRMAALYVDFAKWKLGAHEEKEDPLWADLVAESNLREKLKQEYEDSKVLYMLQRIHKETSKEDFENKLFSTIMEFKTYGELYSPIVTKWSKKYNFTYPYKDEPLDLLAFGLNDPLVADVVTKERNYFSSLIAELNVNAARRKLGADVMDKEPLWADLVAESKLCEKLEKEYQDSKLHYRRRRLPHDTSEEDFETLLYIIIKECNTKGQHYSDVVTKWLKKYGFRIHSPCVVTQVRGD